VRSLDKTTRKTSARPALQVLRFRVQLVALGFSLGIYFLFLQHTFQGKTSIP